MTQSSDDTDCSTHPNNTWYSKDEGHWTRAGRHFKPANLEVDHPGRILEEEREKDKGKEKEEDEDDIVLRQLKKIQANVSIWGLLMASQKHRQALLNILNKSRVSLDTTLDDLVNLINPEKSRRTITITDKDLPSEPKHNKPLHITIECLGRPMPVIMIMIDNGSALNISLLRTAECLGLKRSDFTPSVQGVRAYDNTQREVLGSVVLLPTLGPLKCDVQFQVLDVAATFNMILGWPWLHEMKAVYPPHCIK